MKCQVCQANEANVQVKQILDGEIREIAVCQDCASKSGLNIQLPVPMLTDFLFGAGVKPEPAGEDKVCPECHMRYSDFRKASLLGCAACYDAFAEEVESLLVPIHEGDRHCGKVPAGEKTAAAAERLKAELTRMISAQNFEKAAELRDRLKALEAMAPLKT